MAGGILWISFPDIDVLSALHVSGEGQQSSSGVYLILSFDRFISLGVLDSILTHLQDLAALPQGSENRASSFRSLINMTSK